MTSTTGRLNNLVYASINAACKPAGKHFLTGGTCKGGIARQCMIFSNKGFTLIELIVVLALISIVLFFATPRFQNTILNDSKKIISRWIMTTTRTLKANALKHQKRYAMHIDLDSGTLWTSSEETTTEETEKTAEKKFQLPGDLKLLDVEYPGLGKVTTGRADIFFYKENYSQAAFIHVEDDEYHKMTFQIEPFLPGVKIFDEYIEFEE